jgi:hypothetical protein
MRILSLIVAFALCTIHEFGHAQTPDPPADRPVPTFDEEERGRDKLRRAPRRGKIRITNPEMAPTGPGVRTNSITIPENLRGEFTYAPKDKRGLPTAPNHLSITHVDVPRQRRFYEEDPETGRYIVILRTKERTAPPLFIRGFFEYELGDIYHSFGPQKFNKSSGGGKFYEAAAPRRMPPFSKYSVGTSAKTRTIFRLSATANIDNEEDAINAYDDWTNHLSTKFRLKPWWYIDNPNRQAIFETDTGLISLSLSFMQHSNDYRFNIQYENQEFTRSLSKERTQK